MGPQNKNILWWVLYDFANSPLVAAIGGLFLAQWLILDKGVPEIWYGSMVSISSVLLLLTSPFWGAWSDRIGRRMPFLKVLTFVLIAGGLTLSFSAVSNLSPATKIVLALGLFFVLQYVYQLSLVFFNSLVVKLAIKEKIGRLSGLSEAIDQISWILGPILLLPFATGAVVILGEPGRAQVFLPAVLILIIFSWPMIFLFKEPKVSSETLVKAGRKEIVSKTISGFVSLFKNNRQIGIFLLAFMLVSDAILTGELYFAIFLNQVYQMSDFQKLLCLVLMEMGAAPSAYFFGRLSDRGDIKKMLVVSCLAMIFSLLLLASGLEFWLAFVSSFFVGIGLGAFFSLSRAFLARFSPKEMLGEYFGFYSTFQRFASIIGPLVWGLIVLELKNYGIISYQVAIISLAVFIFIGCLLFAKIKIKEMVI